MLKKVLVAVSAVLTLAILGAAIFVWTKVRAFDESVTRIYDVPVPALAVSDDPAVIERGRHLSRAIGGCISCHGENLGGGKVEAFGPLGRIVMPNITSGKFGTLAGYGPGELARLVKHGVKKDGTSVVFMPSQDYSWWAEEDVIALASYLKTVPPVDSPAPGAVQIHTLGKVLDRLDAIPLDVARRIDHAKMPESPVPAPDARYGAYLSKLCMGCHGQSLSGGRIPGAPPELPEPLNLTPHETGLAGWTFADFEKLMREGVKKNGGKLDPFMPIDATRNFNDVEMRALWAYLQSMPPKAKGGR